MMCSLLFVACGGDATQSDSTTTTEESSNSANTPGSETDSNSLGATFSCKIDGELWTPTEAEQMVQAVHMSSEKENALAVLGIKSMEANNNVMERFHLKVFNVAGPGEHEAKLCGLTKMGAGVAETYTAIPGTGKINITSFNISTKLVSGNFSFKMINSRTKEEVTVTDGEFSNVAVERQQM